MSKRLIEASILDKIFDFFGGDGGAETKEKMLGTFQSTDPQLARAFKNWEGDLIGLLQASRKVYIKNGADTSRIDKLISKIKQG
jgi:hypothetical protein